MACTVALCIETYSDTHSGTLNDTLNETYSDTHGHAMSDSSSATHHDTYSDALIDTVASIPFNKSRREESTRHSGARQSVGIDDAAIADTRAPHDT